jgi:hypothetical protein
MKTYRIHDPTTPSRCFAFEVENAYIFPKTIARLLRGVNSVRDVKHRFSLFPREIHVEFTYKGHPYVVWEPYADSSRYWIGPRDDDADSPEISELEDVLQRYSVPLLRRLIGHAVMLRLLGRPWRKRDR